MEAVVDVVFVLFGLAFMVLGGRLGGSVGGSFGGLGAVLFTLVGVRNDNGFGGALAGWSAAWGLLSIFTPDPSADH